MSVILWTCRHCFAIVDHFNCKKHVQAVHKEAVWDDQDGMWDNVYGKDGPRREHFADKVELVEQPPREWD